MFVTVNVGNTNTAAGCWQAGRLVTARRRTASLTTERSFHRLLARLMRGGLGAEPIEGAILACVVPQMLGVASRVLTQFTSAAPLVLDRRLDAGIDLSGYRGLLGADRIAACAGAAELVPGAFVVIDLGTASTVSAVDGQRHFVGGLISPGLQMGLEALAERTAQLPPTSLEARPALFGSDTRECLVAGAVHGTAALVDGIGSAALTELGAGATVVLTGGNARRVAPFLQIPVLREPELVMRGLAAVLRAHTGGPAVRPAPSMVNALV